ncbi:MAG: iron-containing alcohol dehydrogenase [Victivallales bacterium]|nr:iron-containing alcohol dehydrogenase [Victivallales bacterium]
MATGRQTYEFFIPNVSLMGVGCHSGTGEELYSRGCKKTLIVTDKGIAAAGLVNKFVHILKDSGIESEVFDGTVPNPTDKNVEEGVEIYKKSNCDSILTLGGGSPHDCGKGIATIVTNGGKIADYEGLNKLSKRMPTFVAVNTTAGTASEMTRFAVITDTSRHIKMVIVDWKITPDVAINDPEIMVGMPPALTAATGMDALTHAVEAYVSLGATPVTDACALEAISLVSQYLRAAVANGEDMEARDKMAYAEYLAGMAFNNAGLGYVHSMAHQAGGIYDLPHGVCNAIILPHVERFNMIANIDKFVDIAVAMGENIDGLAARDAAEIAIESIQALAADVGIPAGLGELGVEEEKLKLMAENAMKDACAPANPRSATLEEIIEIYKSAL